MRPAGFVICALLLLAGVGTAQLTYTVEVGKTLSIELPGSSAAYVLASSVADASFSNGVLHVSGISVGRTTVMVVSPSGVKSLPLVVTNSSASAKTEGRFQRNEYGSYLAQYSSDPQQITNSIDYTRQLGSSFQRLQFSDAAFLSTNSSFTTLPVASLQFRTNRYDLTLADQNVDNSALTAQQVVIRGVHLNWQDWSLHAGYASMMAYQNVFLAEDPEYVFGISRRFRLTGKSVISANAFYFKNPASTQTVSQNGPVATVAYEYKAGKSTDFKAEAGAGKTAAFALSGTADTNGRHVDGRLRILPKEFSSLALNSQHGSFGDLQMSDNFNSLYAGLLSVNMSNYDLATLKEETFSLNSNVSRRLGDHLSLSGGISYSRYSSPTPPATTYQSMSSPVGLNYRQRWFSAGAQYMPTSDVEGHFASGYGFDAGVPIRRFQVNTAYRRDVQIPTVTSVLAAVPALQDLLLRAGIVAATLDDILALLDNSAELNALGFGNLVGLNMMSTRDDFSAGLNWAGTGSSQRRLSATFDNTTSTMPLSSLLFRSESVIYSQKVGAGDELMAAVSLYQTNLVGGSSLHPAVQVSYKHSLKSLPIPMLMKHHGTISGHVFFDPDSSMKYSRYKSGVAGAEVSLDGKRTVLTDGLGYYRFLSVPYGEHRIEVKFDTVEPYFFTTDSPATAGVDSVVDFGLNYVKGQVFGRLRNDVGAGIAGVDITLEGNGTTRRAISGDDGGFQFRGLPEGSYKINSALESYPAGYNLQDVSEKTLEVKPGAPVQVELRVSALRSVAGVVSVYDATLLRPVPQAGVLVRIAELGVRTKTDATGHYILRHLPAGKFLLTAGEGASSRSLELEVPAQPGEIRNMDFLLKR